MTSIVNDRFGRDVTVRVDLDVDREAQQYVSQRLGLVVRLEEYDSFARRQGWRTALSADYRR